MNISRTIADHAQAMRGRVLDLSPHHLDVIADALRVDPPPDITTAARELAWHDVYREHYALTPGDTQGVRRKPQES